MTAVPLPPPTTSFNLKWHVKEEEVEEKKKTYQRHQAQDETIIIKY